MQTRILFVDDDPNVLQGLRRVLRVMRNEWDIDFAESGPRALEILAENHFDVVVTDMRMPGMDGVQLLEEVRKRHPSMVRIVLSGHSDREMILRSVLPAHQYLQKPCDAECLKTTVARACSLRNILEDEQLKNKISQMESLPSLPALFERIMEEMQSPNASLQRIGEIISADVGMTAKVLKLVNSAFFGLLRHVASPAQAVNMLGLETVKALVLTIHVFRQFEDSSVPKSFLDWLWTHSLRTGAYAKIIAKAEDQSRDMVDDSYIAGMLHDCGRLALLANFDNEYTQVIEMAKAENITLWESEQAVFGTTHAQVGAYLMGLWGFPANVVEAIAFHHNPGACPSNHFSPRCAVHVANVLDYGIVPSDGDGLQPPAKGLAIDMQYLTRVGLAERLPSWQESCLAFGAEGEGDGQ